MPVWILKDRRSGVSDWVRPRFDPRQCAVGPWRGRAYADSLEQRHNLIGRANGQNPERLLTTLIAGGDRIDAGDRLSTVFQMAPYVAPGRRLVTLNHGLSN